MSDAIIKERLAEVIRCKEVIGWSWLTLGNRLLLNSSQCYALKGGKRPISESHLGWLQFLAQAVDAVGPLPAETAYVAPAGGAVAMPPATPYPQPAPPWQAPAPAAQLVLDKAAYLGTPAEDVMTLQNAASVIATLFAGLGNSGMTVDQAAGARHVLTELSEQLGISDRVAAQLREVIALQRRAGDESAGVLASAGQIRASQQGQMMGQRDPF